MYSSLCTLVAGPAGTEMDLIRHHQSTPLVPALLFELYLLLFLKYLLQENFVAEQGWQQAVL